MSLEILISKYIDSELSTTEDLQLREALRDNIHSKSKFDAAIDTHHQLKQDAASIRVPEKLLRDTEDKILMNIMATQPASAQITKIQSRWYQYSAAAVILVAFMISGVMQISEQNSPRAIAFLQNSNAASADFDNILASESTQQNSTNSVELKSESVSLIVAKDEIEVSVIDTESSLPASMTKDELSVATLQDNTAIDSEDSKQEIILSEKSIIQSGNTINLMNNSISDGASVPIPQSNYNVASNLPPTYFAEPFMGFAGVQLHTFMSYDFSHSGFKTSANSPILNISQSISYAATDRLGFGVEFGITEFTYDRKQNIYIPGTVEHHTGPSVQAPTGGGDNHVIVPVEIETVRQFMWGTAFMDYSIVKYDDFVIVGRLGLGGSNEGPLGFGRLYAQYDLFRYLSLTIGTEGRLFVNDLPSSQFNRAMRSSSSVVYGIRLKF
ncbi:MAG: Cfr10I/Bse634I family restriction endonuclease [Candidatus Kapabacteria bacterium]|nr:Cfr10I/Bse634I family restriction endonuclease [Candidatus Kapabacteria bacterium]